MPKTIKRAKRARAPQHRQDVPSRALSDSALNCRRKFLKFFPAGFRDQSYIDWERGYKWKAHEEWNDSLNHDEFRALLIEGQYIEIAARAVRIEARTNLLYSFEKMAIRDAVKSIKGACLFSTALYDFLHGPGSDGEKFDRWCAAAETLPRKKTRVVTWPLVTVFGFIANPQKHIFLKPTVTRVALDEYALSFDYHSVPSWGTYENLLKIAGSVSRDLQDLQPRDMIDIQSFLWIQGSDEYAT